MELVFAFFANPANLPHLMPAAQEARIEDVRLTPPPARPVAKDPSRRFRSLAAGAGTEIILSFKPVPFLPQRVGWTARIVEFEWNSHFIDEQVKGPFKQFRHRHSTEREIRNGVEGTVVRDFIDYELPFGVLGKAGGPVVLKQLRAGWDFRRKRLPEVLAIAAQQATQRS